MTIKHSIFHSSIFSFLLFTLVGCTGSGIGSPSNGISANNSFQIPGPNPGISPTPVVPPSTPGPTPAPTVAPTPVPTQEPTPPPMGNNNCFPGSAEQAIIAFDGGRINSRKICGDASNNGADFLPSPGSENWVIAAQAALYIDQVNGTGSPKWFTDYFRVQLDGSRPYDGGEFMSYAYGPYIVGAITMVRRTAQLRDHTELYRLATEWLKIYWTLNAIVAVNAPITSVQYEFQNRPEIITPWDGKYIGLSISKGAARSLATGTKGEDRSAFRYPAGSADHFYLSLALDWNFSLVLRVNDDDSRTGMFIRGVQVFRPANMVIDFGQQHLPAENFGLSEAERAVLSGFVSSKGKTGGRQITSWLQNIRPKGSATFIRSEDGATGFLGKPGGSVYSYNLHSCKTPIMAATFSENGKMFVAHPYVVQATCHRRDIKSFQSGEQICVTGDSGVTKCIDVAPGTINFMIEVGPDGTVCHEGCST